MNALEIFGYLAAILLLTWGFYHESDFIAFENKVANYFKYYMRKALRRILK